MAAPARTKARVLVISLGGTIAMTPASDGAGVAPALDGDELVAMIGDLDEVASVETRSLQRTPGAHLSFADVAGLLDVIGGADDWDGFVITQGTDTIEETAYLLDLLYEGEEPVIVTGAMRHPATPGADGPANLLAAIRVAAAQQARGLGVLVVMNDEIHAARLVRKVNTMNPAAFASVPGPLGWLAEGRPQLMLRPSRREALPPPTGPFPRVALVTAALGDDGTIVEALPGLGFEGVVIEALGGGHLPPGTAAAVSTIAEAVPVVLASRTGSGSTLEATYDFPGSEIDLLRKGAVSAGCLDGAKARILLTVLLALERDRDEITAAFTTHGGDGGAPRPVLRA